jgi:predicted enzyme related to lactoylglutathione lyase
MAHLTGVDFVALQVHDMEVSRRFYTEQLGLTTAPHSPPNAVVFQTSPIPFAIRTPSVDLSASTHLGWGVALWFACDDADALCASLEATGVNIVQQPFDGTFGRTFSFSDPDGYTVTAHGG